jgi:hypothetical protein
VRSSRNPLAGSRPTRVSATGDQSPDSHGVRVPQKLGGRKDSGTIRTNIVAAEGVRCGLLLVPGLRLPEWLASASKTCSARPNRSRYEDLYHIRRFVPLRRVRFRPILSTHLSMER